MALCNRCRFWDRREDPSRTDIVLTTGRCRLRAPVVIPRNCVTADGEVSTYTTTEFPETDAHDWCGEWTKESLGP